jgi:acetyl coenzyme A synthetase (ADP forming)-like protein
VTDPIFQSFFSPRGVVVVGVSQDPAKLGYGLARNLVASGYPGAIHFVNPRGGTLFERPVSPNIPSVPDPVDLAVLATPAAATVDGLRACHARGIRAVIVASGGFKEVGAEGAAIEAELARVAVELGVRVVGPNCIGLLDTHVPIDTTFLQPPAPRPGEIAFVSHSGAVCGAVVDYANGRGFGFSRMVSVGNQADLKETDLLAPAADDPHTRVIALYLESVGTGPRFVEEAGRVARRVPILALKVGRSPAGQRAAASHTGALAGAESAWDSAFRRAGIQRAYGLEEMFDWARALAWCPLPAGRAMAVLTNAGGPGVIATDALEEHGLTLAALAEPTQAALRAILPAAASVANPVDMLAAASPQLYAEALRLLLADPGVHGVIVLSPPPPLYTPEAIAEAVIPVAKGTAKPVLVGLLGAHLVARGAALLAEARVPDYRFPEQAASALAALVRRAEWLAQVPQEEGTMKRSRSEVAWETIGRTLEGGGGWLPPEDATRLLEAYGIRVPKLQAAGSAAQAAELARMMGFPVVMKVASPDITHKSDVGGVVLDLTTTDAVTAAFGAVTARARAARPDARILGVHLQPMLPKGQEVIAGAIRDPQFGAQVMFGSGGVEVEGLKDVAFGLAPLPRAEAEEMLERTWAGRRLRGFRDLPPADRGAVVEVLLGFSRLVADFPEIAEAEINPLRALPEGQGAVALDARFRVAKPAA